MRLPLPEGWWHLRRSLASRVTLLTTIAVGFSIAMICLGGYVTVRHQLQANTDESLLKHARAVASDPSLIAAMANGNNLVPVWALGTSDVRAAVLEPSTREVHIPDRSKAAFPRPGQPEWAVAAGQAAYSIRTIDTRGDVAYRVAAVPAPGTGYGLIVAQSLEPQHRMLVRLGIVMLAFGAAGVIVSGLLGWAVATGSLRPVRRLTADAERIARTEDLTPLPVGGDDEIGRLAQAFNGMLVALAGSRDRQRQLVADASHELRTPLTSLRTNLDLLAQADSSTDGGGGPSGLALAPDQRAELLADVRAQIEELTTLIGDLVELARDEPAAPAVEAIDLPDVLDHALERVRRRAPHLRWEVDADPWWTLGDSGTIERAITNLLDNAAKWSPEGGTVRLALRLGVLTVDDEGPGIAAEDLPHVFDRFYRAAESRSMPGSGLGLAIVRQTAERAGGSVTAERSPYGGARLTLRLPGAASPRPAPIGDRVS